MMSCSIVSAYTPKVAVRMIDTEKIYNPQIVESLTDSLIEKLLVDEKFIVYTDEDQADYIIEGKIAGMGNGALVNDAVGNSFSIGGSASSIFISPFGGPLLGGFGILQTRKNVFAIAVRVSVIRSDDDKIILKRSFLGRTNLKKQKMSQEILLKTINHTTELIAKRLIKDVNREKPKVFVEPTSEK